MSIVPDELIFAVFPFFLEHEARGDYRVSARELGAMSLDLPMPEALYCMNHTI